MISAMNSPASLFPPGKMQGVEGERERARENERERERSLSINWIIKVIEFWTWN